MKKLKTHRNINEVPLSEGLATAGKKRRAINVRCEVEALAGGEK
jgi:hypothetical protein